MSSNHQPYNEQDEPPRHLEDNNDNEIIDQVGLEDLVEEEEAAVASYILEGYTPLNFYMNAFALLDDSDDEYNDLGGESDEEDGNDDFLSTRYHHLGSPQRRINGVKSHAGEFAPSFHGDTDGLMTDDGHHSDSDAEDLVPSDFHSLAERVLRGLDEDHQVTLQRSDQETNVATTLNLPLSGTIRADDQQSIHIIPDCLLENKEDDGVPAFEAPFPTNKISAYKNLSVEKPSTPRRIPVASMNSTNNNNSEAKMKPMDINAIKRAMQSIRIKSPKFASTLDAGSFSSSTALLAYKAATLTSYDALIHSTCLAIQERQNFLEQAQQKSLCHQIIPERPLAAFRRNTPKAYRAAHNLSRSATLAEALVRLWPLICFRRKLFAMKQWEWSFEKHDEMQQEQVPSRLLTIHIIGADGVECSSEDSVRNSVGAFVRWLDAALQSGALSDTLSTHDVSRAIERDRVLIEFSGPNMPEHMVGKEIDLLPRTQSGSPSKGLESATCVFFRREYHQTEYNTIESTRADLTVAFNAGIWGYDSWKPTLTFMMRKSLESLQCVDRPQMEIVKGALFVITAYTYEECEDDADVIAGVAQDLVEGTKSSSAMDETNSRIACQLWSPENNFFASRMERTTASAAPGKRYFENGEWQAWLFGV